MFQGPGNTPLLWSGLLYLTLFAAIFAFPYGTLMVTLDPLEQQCDTGACSFREPC